MKAPTSKLCLLAALALGVACQVLGADAPAPSPSAAAGPKPVDPPKSVFAGANNASEGRNPFFPNSTPEAPRATVVTKAEPAKVDVAVFTLNGITSPPRRTAMINGRTFEPGEEGEVKVRDGSKRLIKCVEIKDESAVIVFGGVRHELRMRFAL